MRTLVTGASGFSGGIIARTLARDGFDVVGLFRHESPALTALSSEPRLRLIRADLVDAAMLPGPFDTVVHVAATSPGPGVTVDRIVRDNVSGTFALIESALAWRCQSFIFFSSLSVYGEFSDPVVDESAAIHNPDAYGVTKYLAECRLAELSERMSALSLRLPGIVGPGAQRNWLSSVAAKLCKGDTIRAFHLDRSFNNAVHITDIAAFVGTLLRQRWNGYDAMIVGARGMTTVRAAIERLARGLGVLAHIEPVAPNKTSFTLSCNRAIARYGYAPMDIERVIDHYARDIVDRR